MPSLRQILAAHAPLLLLDAASSRVQAGLFADEGVRGRWEVAEEEAGVGIFRCVDRLGVDLAGVRAFAFSEGPGSMLGVRTVAMALRTWCALDPRPVFAYGSLAVVAEGEARPGAAVIADARRDSWHHCVAGGSLQRFPTEALSGTLLTPEGFRNWTPLPAGVERVPYLLSELLPRVADADLFRLTGEPDAFLHREPEYAAWTPRIHRAPS